MRLAAAEHEQLVELRARLSAIVESAGDAIISKTPNGIITSWNRGAERIFGYNADEMVGQNILTLVPPERTAEETRFLQQLQQGRTIEDYETVRIGKNGQRIHVNLSISPIFNENGEVMGATKIARDITAIKRTQDELEGSVRENLNLRAALDEHAIVAKTDPQGRITYANDKFCAISKYSRAELLGQDHRLVNSGYHSQEFFRDLWSTIGRGGVWKGEIRNRAKDGSHYWVATTIVPFLDADSKPYQYIALRSDITGLKTIEEEVRRLNEGLAQRVEERTRELAASNRELEATNKELEAFSYSVSHDLRAPLRHISGFVNLILKSGVALPPETARQIGIIANSATQMGRLVDDLLVFSRMGRKEMRKSAVNMDQLVKETLQKLKPEMEGRNIVWKQSPLPEVQADPSMLCQVLINLISNAIKYTRPRDPAEIEIGCHAASADEHVFFVRDNGVGFDMRYSDKLFGVFQRLHLDEEFEGTGIGLANVRRIIQRHGGRAWGEGKLNAGATFYFSLPKK